MRSDSDGEENHRLGKNPTVVSNKTASEGKGSSATYHSHHSSNSGSVASIQNSAGGSSKTHNSHTQHYTGRSKVAGPSTNLSQQTQMLNAGTDGKQPSLMRGLIEAGNQNRGIKIISQNKIRQSPSPPPNLVINSQAPPTVTNIQVQMKQQ